MLMNHFANAVTFPVGVASSLIWAVIIGKSCSKEINVLRFRIVYVILAYLVTVNLRCYIV